MGITLEAGILGNLTYRGVLAYVATQALGDGRWTTAQLAQAVNCNTSLMLIGMQELQFNGLVDKPEKHKWTVSGTDTTAAERVQILDSAQSRRADFVDDLKKYFEFKNPQMAFTMGAADGQAVNNFLRSHKDWTQEMWRAALTNRAKSEVNHSQPLYLWVTRLAEYATAPLDRYGKPMANGGGKHGKALETEQRNREAREAVVAGAKKG